MPKDIIVRVADYSAGDAEARLVTLGLGSCVAIILYDATARIGGLAHILLPSLSLGRRGAENPAKFPQTAVPALLTDMGGLGAERRRITARLVGGASMFANLAPPGSMQMGERNVVATREVLNSLGIPITAESVGGDFGRSVHFTVGDGVIRVRSVAHGEQSL
ncbi:MAG TPA: chemotaxis protein CheD [Gemmatimonadales bacterium]|nr:chemotaxis protein CheD [Gemmatimonadales bacterium]